MLFNIGDLVTRRSHGNDIIFKIIEIDGDTVYLKGLNIRLIADSSIDDLEKASTYDLEDDEDVTISLSRAIDLNRDEFFYLPGKILHIDADKEYLERCMSLYKKMKIMAYGVVMPEKNISEHIKTYLEKVKPDIVVITGHDARLQGSNKKEKVEIYKNSNNFIKAVQEARTYENSQEKLIVIAGACQSNYEELIKAGANFASSPKRINIHALDPAIIASLVALSDRSDSIDLIKIINSTKYKKEGIGGIITRGTMYVGYPR